MDSGDSISFSWIFTSLKSNGFLEVWGNWLSLFWSCQPQKRKMVSGKVTNLSYQKGEAKCVPWLHTHTYLRFKSSEKSGEA